MTVPEASNPSPPKSARREPALKEARTLPYAGYNATEPTS
jgi:hypothetical protein